MSDEFDLHTELAAGVRDAAGAWRFVRWFAERYSTPIVDGDGFGAAELADAEVGGSEVGGSEVGGSEERLGVALVGALREAYSLFGKRNEFTRSQDRLLAPHQVHVDDTGQVLVFRWECQHVAEWGIPLATLGEADPPVVFRVPGSRDSGVWRPYLDRVSTAAVEMALSEWMFSGDDFVDNRDLDDAARAVLEGQFRRLPMPDYPFWAGPDSGPVRWFAGPGVILREARGRGCGCGRSRPAPLPLCAGRCRATG